MQNKKGSILAYSLVIISIMLAIAASLSLVSIVEKKSASSTVNSMQALQTADSGINLAMKKIGAITDQTDRINVHFPSCAPGGSVAVITNNADGGGGAFYDLTFLNNSGNKLKCNDRIKDIKTIASVGTYKQTARAVSVSVNSNGCGSATTINDIRGAESIVYPIVTIGTQCWMAENLRTARKPDGTVLTLNNNYYCWEYSALYPAFNADPNCATSSSGEQDSNGAKYGAFYPWQTMVDNNMSSVDTAPGPQGICPNGWHIPVKSELDQLVTFLGGGNVAGPKMRSGGSSGFNFPMAGQYAPSNGGYILRGNTGNFYTASYLPGKTPWYLFLSIVNKAYSDNVMDSNRTVSIRCLKN